MRIKEITDEYILFDDNKKITYYHDCDCCEFNYADFMAIKTTETWQELYFTNFYKPLVFEKVEGCGFRFGNIDKMFFVPCYSIQNGFYSDEIGIRYDGIDVFNGEFSINTIGY